ncbi:hypothetical protein GCM10011380_05600 [Sphingomonas metalli]|uniref:Lipoprotein n=1 Tax=Sphingomonas metalli TaxID=1779358 RepID=A0A916SUZ3_9SPHN|nr:hypothetical protein [Sphingomonas metalli]GGB18922.1 hypothetical protein GCM10011380_05600 [Sphingomonas metalli]
MSLRFAAALALLATGCAGDRVSRAEATLAAVQARYAAVHRTALLFAPFLPPDRAARVRALADLVELTLAAARAATGFADRAAAIERAAAAADAYRAAAGG